jgi:pimeloyl-ACP methyl ester carboxylesterase
MAVGVWLAVAVQTAPALATNGGPVVPVLSWSACSDPSQAGFECAAAEVPLDYRQPKDARITLVLIRHRASQPARRVGSLFFNPGGPGGSGVQSLSGWYPRFPPTLRQRFDLISWDPRGIGASTAVSCFASHEQGLDFFADAPAGFPVGPPQVRAWIDIYTRFGRMCGERNGDLLAHVSTADTARDLELLRRAVGEPWMNYYGTSYGTFLGATYANLYPGRVRAMVLDGNVDPVAWTQPGERPPFLSTSLRLLTDLASNRGLTAFLDQCGEAGVEHCAFAAGDAAATRAKFATLLERIRKQPILYKSEPITYAALLSGMADLIFVVPAFAEFPGWTATADLLQTLWTGGSGGTPPARPYQYPEQGLAVQCGESPNPRHPGYYRALAVFAFARAGDVGPNWSWNDEPCASWPAVAADACRGPWDRHTANPLLVIGNTFDPSTPYEGSVAMVRELAPAPASSPSTATVTPHSSTLAAAPTSSSAAISSAANCRRRAPFAGRTPRRSPRRRRPRRQTVLWCG